MNYQRLLFLTNNFYRISAVQSVRKLKGPMGQQFQNSNMWFSDYPAISNQSSKFAIFDKENLKNIKEVIGIDGSELIQFYLSHHKIRDLISFIVYSYNKYFPNLDGNVTFNYLKESGNLDEIDVTSNTPIFILMHDLIHQIIEHNFVESLEGQTIRDRDNDIIAEDVTTLLDEIYEDLASSLSNLNPAGFTGQGLTKYVRNLFYKYLGKKEINEKNLKETIDKIFHQAKAELRGKIDSPKIRRRMGKNLLNKYRNTEKASGRIKQFVETQLSKYKNFLIEMIPEIMEAYKDKNNYKINSSNVFEFIQGELTNFLDEYSDAINEADVLDPVESSAMRGWLLECLKEMKKVSDYFEHKLYEEYNGIDNSQEDEIE